MLRDVERLAYTQIHTATDHVNGNSVISRENIDNDQLVLKVQRNFHLHLWILQCQCDKMSTTNNCNMLADRYYASTVPLTPSRLLPQLIIWRVRWSCGTDRLLLLILPGQIWMTREWGKEEEQTDRQRQDCLNSSTVISGHTQCWTDTCGDGQIPNKMPGIGSVSYTHLTLPTIYSV